MNDKDNRWTVTIDHRVKKRYRHIPKHIVKRLDRIILALAEEPRPPGCKKLSGYSNLYRLRAGNWRIVYAIEDDQLLVLIIEVGPRGGAYRTL